MAVPGDGLILGPRNQEESLLKVLQDVHNYEKVTTLTFRPDVSRRPWLASKEKKTIKKIRNDESLI